MDKVVNANPVPLYNLYECECNSAMETEHDIYQQWLFLRRRSDHEIVTKQILAIRAICFNILQKQTIYFFVLKEPFKTWLVA